MQHWIPPIPTDPAGTRVRGVSSLGSWMLSGIPVMYGRPGVNPMK